jgi:hypothetical protein
MNRNFLGFSKADGKPDCRGEQIGKNCDDCKTCQYYKQVEESIFRAADTPAAAVDQLEIWAERLFLQSSAVNKVVMLVPLLTTPFRLESSGSTSS